MPFKLTVLLLFALLASCAKETPLLRVDSFKMKDTELANKNAAMVRGDQNYLLFGKISKPEREKTAGHYLTVRRKDTGDAVKMRFTYQQVRTGSKKLVKEAQLAPDVLHHEFSVSGEDYKTNGRILAWHLELLSDTGKSLASKQSYLWQ